MTTLTISPAQLDIDSRRNEINTEHDRAITALIECGRLLVDTQNQLPDDDSFVAFCDTLKFRRATAYNYIKLYAHSLVQRLDTLQDAMINLSVWYVVKPEDSQTIQKIQALAESGKKVTPKLARQLVQERAPLNDALLEAAEIAPDFVADTLMSGIITDIDGQDIPVDEADSTLIRVNTDQFLYESVQRQHFHIEANTPKRQKVTAKLHLISDRHGVAYLAIDASALPINLSGREVTIYYEVEVEQAKKESAA